MKHSRRSALPVTAVFALAASLAFPGCKKKGDASAGVAGDYDYITGTPLSDRNEGVNFLGAGVDRSRFEPIFFGYDSSQVPGEEMGKIQTVASFLSSGSHELIVAGFTDERGTPEYNRSLGELRAQAVRQALVESGASPSSIQTVSFGEELPADPGSGDSAWARNRRAEFGVVK